MSDRDFNHAAEREPSDEKFWEVFDELSGECTEIIEILKKRARQELSTEQFRAEIDALAETLMERTYEVIKARDEERRRSA